MKKTYLKDYTPPSYWIRETEFNFSLDPKRTVVKSKLKLERNSGGPLVLDGKGLELISVKIDGTETTNFTQTDDSLTLTKLPASFVLEIENVIAPEENTALEGLYMSNGMFCTQNEAQGFRRITYYQDRPDVMSCFTTTLTADKGRFPILLSNGNPTERGDLEGGKHFVKWVDPFPKPCYLFALVGGDLALVADTFKTRSGRDIALELYTEKGYEKRCDYAMGALKRAMTWDEETFGLEYDLDIYMIVAVDSFNMGAMENKGLNIFNTSCVLADDKTATDENYLRVEQVVAHEYFHNWTGNRVTCRDWFQLTLKEGLTVFRDQEFSSDMHNRDVKRIEDVIDLRVRQFPEDAGPLAHPIQPDEYLQIDNFYTATVYDKGAEVIRMIDTLIGRETFKRGITKYFELFDGQAATTEDFIHSMELVSEKDFTQFRLWYHQKGTPLLTIYTEYNHFVNKFTIVIEQSNPTQNGYKPMHIPFKVRLIDQNGGNMCAEQLFEIKKKKEVFEISNIHSHPIPSFNRNFTAPIQIKYDRDITEIFHLMQYDSDPVARFEASQEAASLLIVDLAKKIDSGMEELFVHPDYIDIYHGIVADEHLDPALKCKLMLIPQEATLFHRYQQIPFELIHQAREVLIAKLARDCKRDLKELYLKYVEQSVTIGERALRNLMLRMLTRTEDPEMNRWAYDLFSSAQTMTDEYAGLSILADIDCNQRVQALEKFYEKWKGDTLTMNKWLLVQSLSSFPGALGRVKALLDDPIFDFKVPNLVRSLLNGFVSNHHQFHDASGSGYAFIADMVIKVDSINPHAAARLCGGFKYFKKLDPSRGKLMKREMERVLSVKDLSTNVYEIIDHSLHK